MGLCAHQRIVNHVQMYRTMRGLEIRVRQLAIFLIKLRLSIRIRPKLKGGLILTLPHIYLQSGRAEPYVKLVSQSESLPHGQRIPKENATPVIAKQRSTNKQFRRLTQKDLTGSDARLTVDLTLLGMVMF